MQRIGPAVLPENGDLHSQVKAEESTIPTRAFYMATVFIFFTGGFYFWWLSVFGVNTLFFKGYPQLGTLLPGTLFNARRWSDWYWWLIYLLSWNGLAPMLLAMALTHNRVREWAQAHQFVCTYVLTLLNVFVLVALTVLWATATNNAMSGISTAANDYQYCCVFWPNPWCPNNSPCIFDPVRLLTSSSQLTRNEEITAHWAFCFVFLLLNWWQLMYSENLRRNYGVLVKF